MARPIFAPGDIALIKKCITKVIQSNDKAMTNQELRELEIIYHRLGRLGVDNGDREK